VCVDACATGLFEVARLVGDVLARLLPHAGVAADLRVLVLKRVDLLGEVFKIHLLCLALAPNLLNLQPHLLVRPPNTRARYLLTRQSLRILDLLLLDPLKDQLGRHNLLLLQ
jgi:hypothetical protein